MRRQRSPSSRPPTATAPPTSALGISGRRACPGDATAGYGSAATFIVPVANIGSLTFSGGGPSDRSGADLAQDPSALRITSRGPRRRQPATGLIALPA